MDESRGGSRILYPKLFATVTEADLATQFQLAPEEGAWAATAARGGPSMVVLLTQLKVFQCIGWAVGAKGFTNQLREILQTKTDRLDLEVGLTRTVQLDRQGRPIVPRIAATEVPATVTEAVRLVMEEMPERSVLEGPVGSRVRPGVEFLPRIGAWIEIQVVSSQPEFRV